MVCDGIPDVRYVSGLCRGFCYRNNMKDGEIEMNPKVNVIVPVYTQRLI